jgi:hypothetical protein
MQIQQKDPVKPEIERRLAYRLEEEKKKENRSINHIPAQVIREVQIGTLEGLRVLKKAGAILWVERL